MGTASRQLPAEGNGREVSVEDLLQAPTARQPGLQAPTAYGHALSAAGAS